MTMRLKFVRCLLALAALLLSASCKRTPEARFARFMATGQRHFEQKDYARAILDFQNAVKLAPNNPEPYYRLGLAHLESGNFRAGVAHLMKATELNPRHVGAQLKLAQLMATSRRQDILEEAAKRAQAAFAVAPEDAAVLNTLALTELRLGKPEDAQKRLEQTLEKFPGELNASVMLAKVKLAQKDLAGAEAVLKQAAARAPKSPEPALALSDFYLAQGRTSDAEAQLARVLEIDPNHGPALLRLAELRLRAGHKDEAASLFRRLASVPDRNYRPAYALFLLSEGKATEAVAELERLHRADPSDRNVRSRLVAAYLAVNRAADAQRVLDEAIKRNARDTQALLQRGALLARMGKWQEAEQDLVKVLRIDPESGEAHYHLAVVRRGQGEAATARQELAEAVRLNPSLLAARLELAGMLLRENSARAALDLLDQAPAFQKNDIHLLVTRNSALMALGDYAKAREGVKQALAIARTSELLTQDGNLRLLAKDFAGARKSLEEALERNPENVAALNLLASSFVLEKQPEAAAARVRKHAQAHPKSAAVQTFAGEWLWKSGRAAEARAAFAAARAADPKAVQPALRLAQVDAAEGKLDSARGILNELLKTEPRHADALALLASLEHQAGNYQAAAEAYRKALDIQPRNVLALNNLAFLLVENLGRPDEGLQLAQKAKELAPDSAAVDDTLGWAYYHKGLYGSAVQHLERAASGPNATALRKFHLAMAYWKAGEPAKARLALAEARRLDPRLPQLSAAAELMSAARRSGP